MRGEEFKPDPSIHSDPATLAACPVCNPKPKATDEARAVLEHSRVEYCSTGQLLYRDRRRVR